MNCPSFTSETCVNGNCPIALDDEFPWSDSGIKSCDECPHNTFNCSDCIFLDSDRLVICQTFSKKESAPQH